MTNQAPSPPDPASLSQLRALFARHGFRPRRSLGQTFLTDANIVARLLDAAEIGPGDPALEIGAGAGVVTRALARAAERVVAVEIDPRLVAILAETVPERAAIVQADVLAVDWAALLGPPGEGRWKVVANLPYAIIGPAIVRLLEACDWVERFVIMAQREVAERLAAPPGQRARSAISVLAQAAGEVKVVRSVPRTCFYPRPRVDSAIVTMAVRRPGAAAGLEPAFQRVVRAGFGARRKMLLNALSGPRGLGVSREAARGLLEEADVSPKARAEALSVEQFVALARVYAAHAGEVAG